MQVKILTEELKKANDTIQFLSQITGQDPSMISEHLKQLNTNRGSQDMKQLGYKQKSMDQSKISEKQIVINNIIMSNDINKNGIT